MELLQLNYFLQLAKYEHLTRVAEAMYVSPSAISTSIARLEEELGTQLFDRKGRSIKLNQYGKAYLPYVKRVLSNLADGERELRDMKNDIDHCVSVVMSTPILWQDSMLSFSELYPDIHLRYSHFDPTVSFSKFPDGNVDFMIHPLEGFSDPSWEFTVLSTDEIGLAVPNSHWLSKKERIWLKEASNESFIGLSDSIIGRQCNKLFQSANFTPNHRLVCDVDQNLSIAMREQKVTLTSCSLFQLYAPSEMVFLPLFDKNTKLNYALFWEKNRYASLPFQQMKSFLTEADCKTFI